MDLGGGPARTTAPGVADNVLAEHFLTGGPKFIITEVLIDGAEQIEFPQQVPLLINPD